MNSSTGFKKRSILRPPSGLRQRQRDYLKVFDISQAQPLIANQVKSQIIRIQQQINELDKDKKIRAGDGSLQKSYVTTLKKWLRDAMNIQEKQEDDGKILKYMGVDSYESGFRKLWKVLSNLDNMITKITQLEIIQFLKYDQIFNQLAQDSQKTSQILSTLSKTGFSSGTFQISQVLLQRNKDLYSLLLQSKRKGGSSFLTERTQKQSSKKNETNQLIAQLQKQNSKLSDLLEQLQKQKQNNQQLMRQLRKKEEIIKENTNIANNASQLKASTTSSVSSGGDIFKQLQDRYKQRLTFMSNQVHRLESQISELKILLSTTQSKLKLAQEDIAKQPDITQNIKVKSGSYEEALLQEMQKMKKGFEKKIQKLMDDFNQKQKDMRRKEIQYKNQNDKIKWEKGLLLKKFDSIQQVQAK